MGSGPSGPASTPGRPTFSPDGFWWWDGTQWRAAVSPDGYWRWNGQAWEPNRAAPRPAGPGAAGAVAVTVLAAIGVIVLVSFVLIIILLTMGNQIDNVLSNVVAALGSSPSP